jgi:hypothetical protein
VANVLCSKLNSFKETEQRMNTTLMGKLSNILILNPSVAIL